MSAPEPSLWNLVILGAWNTQILTPDGIRKRLFELKEGTPLEIMVSLDQIGSYRIGHDGVGVSPFSNKLEIVPDKLDLETMIKCGHVGKRALSSLPETPVTAVGINFRFRIAEVPNELIDLTDAALDDALSDAGWAISNSLTRRSLAIDAGLLNLEIEKPAASAEGTVSFNFHLASKEPAELSAWIDRVNEFHSKVAELLKTVELDHA